MSRIVKRRTIRVVVGFWARVALPLLLGLTLSGAAAPFSQSQAEVSLTFQDLGPVLTGPEVGLPAGQGVTRPTAAVLPDGRIRLYYFSPQAPTGTLSAISTDGVHFAPEPGQRLPLGDFTRIERLPDGRWRLYFTHRDSSGTPDGIGSAISDDGLSFTTEPGLRLGTNPMPGARVLSCCGIVRLADGRYRMYVSAQAYVGAGAPPPPIYSAVSSNLVDWALEPGIRLTGGSAPAALANPDGSIMLVFSPGFFGGRVQAASSPDGLTFATPTGTNLSGASPAFVTLPDGRLLMYYSTGDPPMIDAAIAVRISAPAVSYPTPAATAITATSARVSAIVDPHGAMSTYAFQYGRSTGYGDSTGEADVPTTSGQQTVGATITGLSPSTTYHFRVNAYNSVGAADGADQTFRTAACPLGPNRDRGWEVALAHTSSRAGALRALRRARTFARSHALVERDGCPDYEAAIVGFRSKGSASVVLRRAKRHGFPRAALERT